MTRSKAQMAATAKAQAAAQLTHSKEQQAVAARNQTKLQAAKISASKKAAVQASKTKAVAKPRVIVETRDALSLPGTKSRVSILQTNSRTQARSYAPTPIPADIMDSEPPYKSAVNTAYEGLTNALFDTDELLSELQERLNPVLRDQPAETSEIGSLQDSSDSAITTNMKTAWTRVDMINRLLQEVISRIDC